MHMAKASDSDNAAAAHPASAGRAGAPETTEQVCLDREVFLDVYAVWWADLCEAAPDGLPVADLNGDYLFQMLVLGANSKAHAGPLPKGAAT